MNNPNEILDKLTGLFTGLRAIQKENNDFVAQKLNDFEKKSDLEDEKISDRLKCVENTLTELEKTVDKIYNNTVIKIFIKNPTRSIIIGVLLFLIISGILKLDDILELINKIL